MYVILGPLATLRSSKVLEASQIFLYHILETSLSLTPFDNYINLSKWTSRIKKELPRETE